MSGSYAVASYGGAPSTAEQSTVVNSTGAGHTVVVLVGAGSSGVPTGVTDSKGNAYTLVTSDTSQVGQYAYKGVTNTPLVGGTDWIKVTYSGSATGQQWIARGMAGILSTSPVDISIIATSPGSASPKLTSASLGQDEEWAMAFLADGNSGGTPSSWGGGFTAQATVQNGGGAYYTFADQITASVNPLQPSASITSSKWCLICISLKFSPVYLAGSTDAAAGSATLSVPITTPTRAGNAIVVVGQDAAVGGGVTAVTDSTGGNTYTRQVNNAGGGFNVSAWTAKGTCVVGAAYSRASYSDANSQQDAANEFDTILNNGNWPTPKLSPRTAAYNVARKYYTEGETLPTSAGTDSQKLADLAAFGVGNVCITFRGPRDGTSNYTGATYVNWKNSIAASVAYIKSVFPNAKFTLWHEANIFGVGGPFGDGTKTQLGSPYGTVTVAQMHANWQAYVQFYGAAMNAAGCQLYWMPSMASPNESIDFFDIALNSTQRSWYSGIGSDNYVNNFIDQNTGNPKASLTQPYGTNNISMLGLAAKYGHPYSIWELGAGTGSPATSNVLFLDELITAPLVQWLASGNSLGEVIWWDYGGDTLSASTDPSVIAAVQRMYDALHGTTTAIPSGGSVTLTYGSTSGVKQGSVIGVTEATQTTPDQTTIANGNSLAPTATTLALSQPAEVAIAIEENANGAGAFTWGGSWTPLVSNDHNGSSAFNSVAYQVVNSTAAVTAAGTVGVAGAWSMSILTIPLSVATVGSGLRFPKPSLSGTGLVASNITGTGSLAFPKPRIGSQALGAPGTPYLVGSATGNGLSVTVPVNTSVSDGDSIQIGVTVSGVGSTPTVGPDTAGNVYTLIASDTVNANAQLFIYESDGANPLRQGADTIPVSQSITGTLGAVAIGDNGVIGGDKAVITHGTSTAPASPTTGVLSQAEEHAIAWIVDAEAGGVPAWTFPWNANVIANVDANAVTKISVAYQLIVSTSALTANGTIASAAWAAACTTTRVAPNVILTTPSNGVVGIPYRQTLESSGGQIPKTFSIQTGSLPPGITISSGVLSGVPTTAGAYPITLQVVDNLAQVALLPVTITILAGASGAAPMSATSNNLLTAADSDFEVTGSSWGAQSNAAAPFATQAIALTGAWALGWAALLDGPTSVSAAPYAVTAGAGYILSGAILPAGQGAVAVGVEWLDTFGVTISTDLATAVSVTGASWAPLAGAFTAPTGAVSGQPVVVVQQANAGDTNFIDMMFFAQSGAQVLVDWINAPFQQGGNAGGAFMDVSPWLRLDGGGISYTLGRQDAISEIQPGSGSFVLQNDQGQFARDSTISLPAVLGGAMTLQRRTQINFTDEKGQWWTRFDGNVSEIDYEFENTGNTSTATISLTDILAHLNRQDPLFCWTKEQVLADGPLYHWSLDDAGTIGGAGIAAETSGNNGPPMRLVSSDSTGVAAVAFQDTSGGVETLADAASATGSDGSSFWTAGSNQPTSPLRGLASGNVGPFTTPIGSAMFTPAGLSTSPWPASSETAQNTFIATKGYELVAELPSPIAPTAIGSDYSIEAWFMPDVSIGSNMSANYGPFIVFGLGSSLTYTNLLAGLFLNAGALSAKCATYSQPPAFKGLNWPSLHLSPTATASTSGAFTPDKVKRPHHLVVTIQGDPTAATVTLWIDGTSIGSFVLPTGQTYDTIAIGGAYGGCGAFFGNISVASVYSYQLSAQQITQHAMLGQYGMWEQTTDDCIAQLAQYASVPGFWANLNAQHAGLTMAEYMDINNANAISAMQQFEAAEHGLLYVSNSGELTFHTRAWRMGYRGPDLLLPQDCFDAGLQYRVVDQFMTNEEGIAGPNTLGATATTLLANPATGQTQTQTNASTVIQAGYTNSDSQSKYGVYAQNPVSSPLTLPLITWSRGFAALGLAQFSFWPDQLSDRAAWDANSRSEPWALPAAVVVDLLTLNPNTGLGISNFYAIGIDNMIAPSPNTLPPSFPNAQTSVEWFVEGITETYSNGSHVIQFYTSPAEPQRAWIPGDATYGVLGSTTRVGISTADTSTIQADGKSVAHDAGGPYWPPTFSAGMNDDGTHGFVGAADVRGVAQTLGLMLKPPLCVVGAESQTQSFNNGALTGTSPPAVASLYWDLVWVDTAGGMGAVPGYPNWYLVTVPGFYEIDACVTWSQTGTGLGGYTGQGWIIVAKAAAQAIAAGTGNPLTVNQYVCPVGEAVRFNASSVTPVCAPTTRMYLGAGDMVCIGAEQNFTSARGTSTSNAGSMMSIRFAGLGKTDDRTLINTLIGSGGTVSLVSHGTLQQATFLNTLTYSYQGEKGFAKNGRRNTNLGCYQGLNPSSSSEGSQAAQIAFNAASILSTLTGKTVLSATLTGTNIQSAYSTGAKLMLGWTKDTPGGSTWDADGSNSSPDVMHQSFAQGQTLTFSIPVSIVNAFVTNSAKALAIGDGDTTSASYYGEWQGGPGSWTLVVNYV